MDSVVHFEIPADDTKRAGEFYSKAFGWEVNAMPEMNYTMVGTAPSNDQGMPTQPGSINGGMPKRGGSVEHIVVTINVQDIDASLKKIEGLGGKTVAKKTPIGEMGFTAYFKDTEGNVVGLWQMAAAGQM
jgi:predicted enzyme related to lactoylglutathione lyase